MSEWTLRLTIPNHEDGGVFPADIIVEEDDEGRKDWECETRRYVPDHTLRQMESENAKLRALVRDMWHDGMCECDEQHACTECEYHYHERMRELGIEVSE